MYWKTIISVVLCYLCGFTQEAEKPDTIPEFPFWTIKEIQIFSVPHDLCLAANTKTMDCFLTVGEYNRRCETLKASSFPKAEMSLDSARRQAFDLLLKKKCAFSYIKERNMDTAFFREKSLDQEKQFYAKDKQKILDKKLYEKYYHYFFRRSDLLRVSLVGSTDSCVIDSWWNCLKETTKKSNPDSTDIGITIPWIEVWDTLLDHAILEKLIKMKSGTVSKPFKTSFGFFLVRLDSIGSIDEVPFEHAASVLHDIKLKYEIDKEIAYEYYKDHRHLFYSPDTLMIKLWLVPDSIRCIDSAAYRLCVSKDSILDHHDTSHTLPLTLTQFDLPDAMQALFADDSLSDSVLYTLSQTPYGKWYFKILRRISGGKSVAFNMIDWPQQDPRVLEAIYSMGIQSREQHFEDHIKANIIKKQLLNKENKPSSAQIAEYIEKGIIDTSIINRIVQKQGAMLQVKKERNEYMYRSGELSPDQYSVLQQELDKKIIEFEKSVTDIKNIMYINVYKNYIVEQNVLNWQRNNIEQQNAYLFYAQSK